jgi:hypothetical protein
VITGAERFGLVGDDDGAGAPALGLNRAPQRGFAGHAPGSVVTALDESTRGVDVGAKSQIYELASGSLKRARRRSSFLTTSGAVQPL